MDIDLQSALGPPLGYKNRALQNHYKLTHGHGDVTLNTKLLYKPTDHQFYVALLFQLGEFVERPRELWIGGFLRKGDDFPISKWNQHINTKITLISIH